MPLMSTRSEQTNTKRYHIRAVDRALAILKLFIREEGEMSASEIGQRLHLHRSTTFRFLATLMSSGFIEQNPGNNKYYLGVASLELGSAFLRHSNLRDVAMEMLEALRDGTGETVHLAILDNYEVIYLEKLAGLHPIGHMSSRVGNRSPAYCTGLGKAILAYLSEDKVRDMFQIIEIRKFTENTIMERRAFFEELSRTRSDGFAVDVQEHELGVMCIAAPVFDHKGVIAAISTAGPSDRMLRKMEEDQIALMVKEAARSISARMGGRSYL
jgi:IclR family acetate operon transcriptional repressor